VGKYLGLEVEGHFCVNDYNRSDNYFVQLNRNKFLFLVFVTLTL